MTSRYTLTRFSRNLWLSAGLVVFLGIAFAIYVRSEMQVEHAYELRHRSFLLADELRQSSHDLTRVVRTYVITGNPVYKQHYQDILDIRNGTKPRPEEYWRIYWDLALPGAAAPRRESRQRVALPELMHQAGFADDELQKLAEAKANSDALTRTEFEAMQLVASAGPEVEANRAKAIRMLFDARYHEAKAAIMKPIDEFHVLVDQRTHTAVRRAATHALALRFVFAAIGLGLIFMLRRTYATMRDTLGGGVDEVYAHITRIGRGDFSVPILVKAGRENSVLGRLSATQVQLDANAHERNRAEAELEQTHRQLLDTSRQAGMAEVATGVLHNVGNVLNSVNVSATLLSEQAKKSKVSDLAEVVALMEEQATDLGEFITHDPRGKQLPGFLAQLSRHLAVEQTTFLKEIYQLRKNVEHIKDIVAMQQSYAKVSGVTETLNISDLVEDALRMNAAALTRHEVEVVREFAEIAPITLDKHKVLQVLVNLIRNAKYACDESGRVDKRLTVRVANGDGQVRIAIIDSGVGIPPENLIRIFNHGFTTRKTGHGFGLHSGALAAKELGGALHVHSEGTGCGATFTLELPCGIHRV